MVVKRIRLSVRATVGRAARCAPGLHPEQLYGPGDLAVTTDFRDVLGEIVAKRLGNRALGELFPGYGSFNFRGLVRGQA